MKIAITGSTGFVGQELVPLLQREGFDLVLIGRDVKRVKSLYPGMECCDYDSMQEHLRGVDAVIHLAVLNNNSTNSADDFHRANVNFSLNLASKFAENGIKKFINLASFQEIYEQNMTEYAKSKKEFSKKINEFIIFDVHNIYVPYIYGSIFGGKLKIINIIPKKLSNFIFYVIKAFKPTVYIGKISSHIVENFGSRGEGIKYLYDEMEENRVYTSVRRIIDLSFAISAIIFFSWLFLIIWIAVQLESGRPGIFSQQRVGRDGKIFNCHKFRTMKQSTAQLGTHEVPASSVTRLGKILRSTKLDELPQVWNILRNEVSLVGPRPCLPVQTLLVEQRSKRRVLSVKPGITGLAQINSVDMSDPYLLAEWDERYIATRSLLLDMKIILSTLVGAGNGDRVRIGSVK